ncbi:thioesterase-like superfamily-domain-containing protein [Mycena alexandri]|uniref:Thioesterase-like superfamily-domain-containing protein n=1 Tax=Mycena alexandri TaxID=1745969 RepID=A0AAD6S7V6_9AGAR|nr:thioesterase-like superfamily-domain-containing protein [Mycena alexandri]KAJ7025122.1 thioesterase-like superfamily-domain-containing protein [Mycena alexandri]
MAPLGKAISDGYDGPPDVDSDTKVYRGDVDPEWTVGHVPNGGYALALVLEAGIQHQSSTAHRDPIHVTAHFLQATSIAPFQVRVRTLKHGRGFTNILADLVQQDRTRIATHIIFGTLEPPRLAPPSRYARRVPLYVHPSVAVETRMARPWGFKHHAKWAGDPHLRAHNLPDSPARRDVSSTTVGGGTLAWGAWFELVGPGERVTPASIAFFADTFLNMPSLLPRDERGGLVPDQTWFPTITLTISFQAPIPPPSARHSARTVGLYSTGTFWGQPQGRHDAYVEVWTAPSDLGQGIEKDGWRENQVCLATATQMALALPMEVNAGRAKYDAPPKAKL